MGNFGLMNVKKVKILSLRTILLRSLRPGDTVYKSRQSLKSYKYREPNLLMFSWK